MGTISTLFGVVILVLDIIAIAGILMGRSSAGRKILWTVAIVLLPVVGLLLYYAVGRRPDDVDLIGQRT